MRVLGDVVISLDTAKQQAEERAAVYAPEAYTLVDEVRVLLVHGVLHLLGYDHELGADAAQAMALEEQRIMAALLWKGEGLVEAAGLMTAESIDSNSDFGARPSALPYYHMTAKFSNYLGKVRVL